MSEVSPFSRPESWFPNLSPTLEFNEFQLISAEEGKKDGILPSIKEHHSAVIKVSSKTLSGSAKTFSLKNAERIIRMIIVAEDHNGKFIPAWKICHREVGVADFPV